ncbi:hypothetical protein LTR78_000286 [Recurvomyces mirabilis]|uniref:Conserved oligomeric Golgi complex subunit 2 n=1 Tax=Recurvomyces mirabilis TaxID=574656 RepID=A0AAE1C6F3_9PEZI|nr:hypothetical protein LTR78_000286 [Recurvomyces mirabilis]KAK5161941.1 hypothetical protein LTS14_000287 [Recurvomyces mirabilis]
MSQFYIPSSTTTSTPASRPSFSANSDDDEDTLPYPAELPRSDFLAQDFNPETYLSSLRNRHQTLEDLRSDLRSRSQLLNRELLDLVNGNYEEFLSLGSDLQGGEEKFEGVRVGVLGFQREVEGLAGLVEERRVEVERLLVEKREVRREVLVGRALLEVEAGVAESEETLGIADVEREEDGHGEEDEFDDDFDDDEDDGVEKTALLPPQLRRLQRHTEQYILLIQTVEHIGPRHPFLQAQTPRLAELRKTLLLDLAAAMRQAKTNKAAEDLLVIVQLYGDLGAESDGVRVLRGG